MVNLENRHYVYALLCQDINGPGYVKFGRSSQIGCRLAALRTNCPIPVEYIAVVEVGHYGESKKVEKALHGAFSDRRIKQRGEWFRFEFSKKEDKEEFNTKCREVLAKTMKTPAWWTKINIDMLDEYARVKRSKLMNSPKGQRILKQQRELDKMGITLGQL